MSPANEQFVTIRLFLASSIIEFMRERAAILSFENALRSALWGTGYVVLFESCDGSNDFLIEGGTQTSLIDPLILECDYILLLVGRTIKPATRHELDLAIDNDKETLALFEKIPDNERDQSAKAAREELSRANLCTCADFEDIGDIKRAILQFLNDRSVLPYVLELSGNRATIRLYGNDEASSSD